jgi:hypothetical protein
VGVFRGGQGLVVERESGARVEGIAGQMAVAAAGSE